jgi:exonuclease VII small subunit
MKYRQLITWILILGNLFVTTSNAQESIDSLAESARIVKELCRGGNTKGSSYELEVDGSGKIHAIILKKLLDAGLDGRVEFSKQEWDGLKPLVGDSGDYVACLREFRPLILRHITNVEGAGTVPPINPLSLLQQERVDIQPSLVQYQTIIDKVATTMIISKIAKSKTQKEKSRQAFKDAVSNGTSTLGELRQNIARTAKRVASFEVDSDVQVAKDEFSNGLKTVGESMEKFEEAIKELYKVLVVQSSGEGSASLETFINTFKEAMSLKSAGLAAIRNSDASFSVKIASWPQLSGT